MKKGLVALLVVLALVVFVSPAIIGRLAEKSLDEQLEWAATESGELVVRSEGFDRGWFSSGGRHRIELRDGRLRDVLVAKSVAIGVAMLAVKATMERVVVRDTQPEPAKKQFGMALAAGDSGAKQSILELSDCQIARNRSAGV